MTMAINPDRIVDRIKVSRKREDEGIDAEGWVIAVVPEGQPMVEPWDTYVERMYDTHLNAVVAEMGLSSKAISHARATFDRAGALLRWRVPLEFYVALDEDGQALLRERPFTFPANAAKEGLCQTKLNPDGIPDLIAEDDPQATQVTQSKDPCVVARWWWAMHYGGYPRAAYQLFRDRSTRTENSPGKIMTRTRQPGDPEPRGKEAWIFGDGNPIRED